MVFLPNKFYLDDFFEDFAPMSKMQKMDLMKCDIYEKEGNLNIELDIPGYKKENIKMDVEDGILTIEATKEDEKESNDINYYRKERFYGTFKRQFNVGNIDEEKIKAEFKDGVLKISFPKEEKKESKKYIDIN